jgi:hypothetical protein
MTSPLPDPAAVRIWLEKLLADTDLRAAQFHEHSR